MSRLRDILESFKKDNDDSTNDEEKDVPVVQATESVITIHSLFSETMQFNTLHVPEVFKMTGEYNYYVANENDGEYHENKDEMNMHDAPMFISMHWLPIESTDIDLVRIVEDGTGGSPNQDFHGIFVDQAAVGDGVVINEDILASVHISNKELIDGDIVTFIKR